MSGIPLDKAELLATLLESFLYGFSLLLFGATVWTLLCRRSSQQVNLQTLCVACSLLLFSTAHIVVDFIRIMQGLILYRNTFRGGPVGFFSDVTQWTWVAKSYLFTAQTLTGDGVVVWRCYVVWRSKLVMVLPTLLWFGTFAIGIGISRTSTMMKQSGVFEGTISRWITAFWATALATSVVSSLLLVSRVWYIDRRTRKLFHERHSRLQPILHSFIDAGAFYSFTLLVGLVCFVGQTNAQYVVLNMVMPIISITFYTVIIRVGLAARDGLVFTTATTDDNPCAEQGHEMQIRVTTERKVHHDEVSSRYLASLVGLDSPLRKMKFKGAERVEGV